MNLVYQACFSLFYKNLKYNSISGTVQFSFQMAPKVATRKKTNKKTNCNEKTAFSIPCKYKYKCDKCCRRFELKIDYYVHNKMFHSPPQPAKVFVEQVEIEKQQVPVLCSRAEKIKRLLEGLIHPWDKKCRCNVCAKLFQ